MSQSAALWVTDNAESQAAESFWVRTGASPSAEATAARIRARYARMTPRQRAAEGRRQIRKLKRQALAHKQNWDTARPGHRLRWGDAPAIGPWGTTRAANVKPIQGWQAEFAIWKVGPDGRKPTIQEKRRERRMWQRLRLDALLTGNCNFALLFGAAGRILSKIVDRRRLQAPSGGPEVGRSEGAEVDFVGSSPQAAGLAKEEP